MFFCRIFGGDFFVLFCLLVLGFFVSLAFGCFCFRFGLFFFQQELSYALSKHSALRVIFLLPDHCADLRWVLESR